MTTEELRDYEYELIDICIDNGYEQGDEDNGLSTCKDVSEDKPAAEIVYDAYGIPMGASMDEIRKREAIITEFLAKWREANADGKILNDALNDYIYFRNISFTEAREHSSKSYRSTRAVMMLDEVLKNALPVRRTAVKSGDSNQGSFAYMLIMVYRHDELGTVKVTVGVRMSGQRIQYAISALRPDEPLVRQAMNSDKKKKRKSRK